jgi:two-component system NtrC family response regulator
MAATLLVIDDEKAQLDTLAGFLQKQNYQVEKAETGSIGLQIIRNRSIDLVISDFKMPEMDGLTVLKEAKNINPQVDFIMMTAYGSVESATKAMKEGAVDFLTKPVDLDHLELIITKALDTKQLISENQQLRQQLAEKFSFKEIISTSTEMETVLNTAARVAPSQATVLIEGESGTGKELVARAIHQTSQRKEKPFITVNCAALPENLLESELFGHEKGAFTGADRRRKGRFELADGGTLFLDEIGELSPTTQVKLLRVLQERTFDRLAGTETIAVDVRLLAATNRDLEVMRKENKFRDDLYYRLNVVAIEVPPLRKRRTDIVPLVEHFLRKYAARNNKNISSVSKEAMDLLIKYAYPGNVRELENTIEQAVVLSRSDLITNKDLPITVQGLTSEVDIKAEARDNSFESKVAAFEMGLIREALHKNRGVQTKAADFLGMTERHLRYKLKKYGMK